MRSLPVLGLGLALAACGDDGGVPSGTPDAAVACGTSWVLEQRPATAIELLDGAENNGARTVRVGVTLELGPCEEPAIASVGVAFEAPSAIISPAVWRQVGGACSQPARTVVVPVAMRLTWSDTTWTITATGEGQSLTTFVADGPADCDADRSPCQADCDCDTAAGERCLGFDGFAGPTTACARPCMVDRDCDGGTCEGLVADGLGYACNQAPECGDGDPCPAGWSCDGGRCTPDFVLSQSTRASCGCDADCDPGLRCVVPWDPAAAPRCQAICTSAGPWCQGPHVCGSVGQDVSGLAGTDSVCGWVGD